MHAEAQRSCEISIVENTQNLTNPFKLDLSFFGGWTPQPPNIPSNLHH